jgi:hypothetical protein
MAFRSVITTFSRTLSVSHFNDILDRFDQALAIVTVSRIAIATSEKLAQEACALRQGIAGLDAVYNELDLAIGAFGHRGAAGDTP